jgi:hypothetical protein
MSYKYTYSIISNFGGIIPNFTSLSGCISNIAAITSPLLCIERDESNTDLFSFIFDKELTDSELIELNSICVPQKYEVVFYAEHDSNRIDTNLVSQGQTTLTDLVFKSAGSDIFVFSSGNITIAADTYFIGQCSATSVGSLTPDDFPNSDLHTINNFGSVSVVSHAKGKVISVSAVLKNPSAKSNYNVYIAVLNTEQNTVRLLNPNSPINISATNSCNSITLDETLYKNETLAPWVEAKGYDLNHGVAITVKFMY